MTNDQFPKPEFESFEPEITWEPSDSSPSVEGYLIHTQTNVGKHGSNLYTIKDVRSTGKSVGVWGKSVIDNKVTQFEPGTYIKIEYLGEKDSPNGRGTYKAFNIVPAPNMGNYFEIKGTKPPKPNTTVDNNEGTHSDQPREETKNQKSTSEDDLPF